MQYLIHWRARYHVGPVVIWRGNTHLELEMDYMYDAKDELAAAIHEALHIINHTTPRETEYQLLEVMERR